MSRLSFLIARLIRDEKALSRLSISQETLLSTLRGQRVALIGNARALSQSRYGAAIDAADLVIRINRAPKPDPESHGARTDWLALAVRLPKTERHRIAADRLLWMSPKRKRLDWHTATSAGFYLHPQTDYQSLKNRLSSPPTTGAMMIDLLLRSDLSTLTLYGFDFFASQSLSGRRTADQVPHDFSAEAAWVHQTLETDRRLILKG